MLCRRVAAIPEGVREVLGLPSVPGGPLPGVPRPASARRGQRSLFEEALSETGSAGSVRTPLHLDNPSRYGCPQLSGASTPVRRRFGSLAPASACSCVDLLLPMLWC